MKFKFSILLFTVFFLIMASCLKADVIIKDPKPLREKLEQIRNKYKLPAMATSVVIGDSVVVASAVGIRKWGEDVSVKRTDSFELGSITKSITGTLIGILCDQGKLSWNTTIAEVYPELSSNHKSFYQDTTICQLMTHTSGMPYQPTTSQIESDAKGNTAMQRRVAYLCAAISDKPEVEPGSEYIYSGGAIIAASIAERITGRSWEQLVDEYIVKELGLSSFGYGPMAASSTQVDAPWFHQKRNGEIIPIAPRGEYEFLCRNPAGTSVHCSVIDLGKYVSFHLSGLRKYKHSSELLKPSSFKELYEIQNTKPPKKKGKRYTQCGLRVQPVNWAHTNLVYWHAGQSKGRGYAIIHIIPRLNYGTCVMINIGGDDAVKAAAEINRLLVDELDQAKYKSQRIFVESN
ncbi:MAG: serine hydrolase domain-containing protein [Planctomycetota bacterium]